MYGLPREYASTKTADNYTHLASGSRQANQAVRSHLSHDALSETRRLRFILSSTNASMSHAADGADKHAFAIIADSQSQIVSRKRVTSAALYRFSFRIYGDPVIPCPLDLSYRDRKCPNQEFRVINNMGGRNAYTQ